MATQPQLDKIRRSYRNYDSTHSKEVLELYLNEDDNLKFHEKVREIDADIRFLYPHVKDFNDRFLGDFSSFLERYKKFMDEVYLVEKGSLKPESNAVEEDMDAYGNEIFDLRASAES